MHRTEGPDYDTVGGKRRYKETPAPGTVVNKDHMNALQEEVCLVVEGVGLTLAATGAADESAAWGQLLLAIRRATLGDVRSWGADPTGTNDSTAAFNSALAANKGIYLPANTIFRLDGALTLPDGGAIVGAGSSSVLKFNTTANKLAITNQDFVFSNFSIIDGGSSPVQNGISILFSADKYVWLDNISINGVAAGLTIGATGAHQGTVYGRNILIENIKSAGNNLVINNTTYACKDVNINHLQSVTSLTSLVNVYLKGNVSNGGGPVLINNSYIAGGILSWDTDVANCWIVDSRIDVDDHRFVSTLGGGYKDCIVLGNEANTITNNITSASRTFWKNVRDIDGTIVAANNYEGIFTERSVATPATVTNGNTGTVDFDTEDLLAMARNASYTKDTVEAAGVFTCKGYGSGRVRIWVNVEIEFDATKAPATYWPEVYVYISWSGENVYLPVISPGGAFGATKARYGGFVEIQMDATDTFSVIVANFVSGGGNDDVDIVDGAIRVEGL